MAPAPSFDLAHLKRVVAELVAKLPPLPKLPFDLPPLPAFVEEALEAPLARPAAAAILVVAATLLAFTVASRKSKAVRGSVYVRGAGGETVRRSSRYEGERDRAGMCEKAYNPKISTSAFSRRSFVAVGFFFSSFFFAFGLKRESSQFPLSTVFRSKTTRTGRASLPPSLKSRRRSRRWATGGRKRERKERARKIALVYFSVTPKDFSPLDVTVVALVLTSLPFQQQTNKKMSRPRARPGRPRPRPRRRLSAARRERPRRSRKGREERFFYFFSRLVPFSLSLVPNFFFPPTTTFTPPSFVFLLFSKSTFRSRLYKEGRQVCGRRIKNTFLFFLFS